MKKLIHPLLYSLCSFLLVISLISCTLTAFSMESADYFKLCAYTLITVAVFATLSITVKNKKMFAPGVFILVMLYVIVLAVIRDWLWRSAVSFCNIILRRLHYAYSWINPVKLDKPADINPFIICAAIFLAIIITVCLVRFRRLFPVVAISIAAVMPCYIVKDTPPGILPVSVCTIIILILFITRNLHRMNISFAPAAFAVCAAVTLVTVMIINTVSASPAKWINRFAEQIPGLEGQYKTYSTGIDFDEKVDLTELDDLDLNNLDEVDVITTLSNTDIYIKDTSYSQFSNNVWTPGDTSAVDEKAFGYQQIFGLPENYLLGDDMPYKSDAMEIQNLIDRERSLYPYSINTYDNFNADFAVNGDISLNTLNTPSDRYGYDLYTVTADSLANSYYHDYSNGGYAEYTLENYSSVPDGITDVVSTSDVLKRAKGDVSPAEKAAAVYEYFSELNGEYSLTGGKIPAGADYLKWFIQKKQGWCIHYATAAALILREVGLPSRYAVGYKFYVGEDHDGSKPVTVTQQSRHAWAEYYDPLYGWLPFDVTPGQGSEQAKPEEETVGGNALENTAPTTAQPTTAEPTTEKPAETETVNPTAETTVPATTEKPADNSKNESNSKNDSGDGVLNALTAVLVSLAAVLVVILIIILRRKLTLDAVHRRMYERDHTQGSIEAYRYAQRLSKQLNEKIPDEVTQAAEKAKFSSRGAEQSDFAIIADYCDYVIYRLEASASVPKKLYYKFILCLY